MVELTVEEMNMESGANWAEIAMGGLAVVGGVAGIVLVAATGGAALPVVAGLVVADTSIIGGEIGILDGAYH